MNLKIYTLPFLFSTAVTSSSFAQSANPAPVAADAASTTGVVASVPPPTGSVSPAESLWTKPRPEANLFELGLFGGIFFPASAHNLQDESKVHRAYGGAAPEFGLRLAYFPLAYLGAELEAASIPAKVEGGGGAGLWAGRGHVIAQLTSHRITPFLLLGYGALGTLSKEMGTDTDGAVHVGLGVKAALDEALSVRLDLRDSMSQKNLDSSAAAHHPELLLGLSMTLDRAKAVPMPPAPPPDADKDGVADESDACPSVAGVAPKGCPPDSDGDGVVDAQDQCPANAGPLPDGCPPPPDSDQDGVLDSSDECADVAGDMANGCPNPDPDGDGVPTDQDRCPKEAESVNGFQDNDGCPDEVPEEVKRFTGVIQGIEFNLGQATIRPDSKPLLDKAVATLTAYPDVRLTITGHTDDVGNRDRNLDLSRRRADEVKMYFVSKGIDAGRITTRGAGPDEPLVMEKTAAARQKNRRIEFSIVNK